MQSEAEYMTLQLFSLQRASEHVWPPCVTTGKKELLYKNVIHLPEIQIDNIQNKR